MEDTYLLLVELFCYVVLVLSGLEECPIHFDGIYFPLTRPLNYRVLLYVLFEKVMKGLAY